jgi:hypothetical protein
LTGKTIKIILLPSIQSFVKKDFAMTLPRKNLVSVEDTPYYHLISRCVRRMYLYGVDRTTGKCYEHRRQCIKDRLLVQRWLKGESLISAEHKMVSEIADVYRKRLSSLSWFMKCLNEPIARAANKEDKCTGHFWDRFFAPAKPAYITSM